MRALPPRFAVDRFGHVLAALWPTAGGMGQLDGLLTPVFWDTTGESRMSAADEGHNRSYVHGLGGIDLQQRPAASNGLGHLVVP